MPRCGTKIRTRRERPATFERVRVTFRDGTIRNWTGHGYADGGFLRRCFEEREPKGGIARIFGFSTFVAKRRR